MYRAKHYAEKKNKKAKNVILAIVAMIELLLLSTTMTFSWFEGTTALRITTDNENYSPLKTSKGINSSYTVGGESSKYSNTAELNEYIEMQANAKFSPVSSYNGEDFFALMDGTATDGKAPDSYDDYLSGITATDSTLKFRQLSNEEKNSSLVYFQFQVDAEVCDTTFWLKELPTFTVNGEALASDNNPFRIRIDDGTGASSSEEHNLILSDKLTWPSGGHYASGASRNNMLAVKSLNDDCTAVLKAAGDHLGNRTIFKVFDYSATSNNKNGKEVLFTVPKGETRTITIAIWLEALDQSYNTETIPVGATVDVDIKFCSSWDVVDTITFRDYTADQWVDNTANKKLWLVNDTTGYSYEMKYTSKGTTTSTVSKNTWTVDVPRAVQDITFRCEDKEYDDTPPGVWAPAALRTVSGVTQTTFTAFGSTAGIWYNGEVTKIEFRDYTELHWINNADDNGDKPKMKVSITYDNIPLNYSMTDEPVADELGKNTWFTYIPSSVDDVAYKRCKRSDEDATVYNWWNATDRGSETVYYALDDVISEDVQKTTIYLKIPTGYVFIDEADNSLLPAVSLTSDYNINYIKNTIGGDLSQVHQDKYYVKNGDNADTWYGTQGKMTKLEEGFYSFTFDNVLADGTYITLWNKPQVNYNNLDNRTRFAPAIQFDSTNNMLTLTKEYKLNNKDINGAFTDAYAYEGNWTLYSSGGDSVVTTKPFEQKGQWGKEELTATGTYTTYFKHSKSVESVRATFNYDGFAYSVDLSGSGYDWSTNKIPDDATGLKFIDNNNSTWAVNETRSKSNNYYYVFNSGNGELSSSGYNRVYLTNNAGWTDAYVYSWVTGSTGSPAWPGKAMTYLYDASDGSKIYAALVPDGNNIAFNNNNAGKQTNDIDASYVYDMCGFVLSGSTSPYEYLIYNASNGNYASASVPQGTYGTRFVHTTSASTVSATFTYNGVSYTVPFSIEEGKIWVTHAMPDSGVTNLVFNDSNGNTWSSTSGRTSTNKYYVTTSTSAGSWKSTAPAQDIVIYVDFSGAGTKWGSGHYLSITSSSNNNKPMNQVDTSGANSYVPKNDAWLGAGTHVSGSVYKWTIPAANVSNLKNYGFTVWSVDESGYDQVWSVDVAHVAYSTTFNTYTIGEESTRNDSRQAYCFTLTASKNTN